jgi:ABC-type arginine transport system permease subunit
MDDQLPPLPVSEPPFGLPPVPVQTVGYVEQQAAGMLFWGIVLAVVVGGFMASFVASITGVIANGMGGNHAGVAVGLTTWITTFGVILHKMVRAALRESRAYRERAYR